MIYGWSPHPCPPAVPLGLGWLSTINLGYHGITITCVHDTCSPIVMAGNQCKWSQQQHQQVQVRMNVVTLTLKTAFWVFVNVMQCFQNVILSIIWSQWAILQNLIQKRVNYTIKGSHTLWNSSRTQICKTFCPNIDLGVLWLKDAIIVLLETIPCPPASEYWRAMVTIT